MLLQPSQRINTRPRNRLPININITIRINIPGRTPQLDTPHDQPDKPEHEEYEGADYHDPGQQ